MDEPIYRIVGWLHRSIDWSVDRSFSRFLIPSFAIDHVLDADGVTMRRSLRRACDSWTIDKHILWLVHENV